MNDRTPSRPAAIGATTADPGRSPGFATDRRSLVLTAGTTLALAIYFLHAAALDYVVDDAYISFQYARNFAEGHGLVYNVGERVEGYTNLAWVLLLGGIAKLAPAWDMLTTAQVLSIAAGAGTFLLLIALAARLLPRASCLPVVAVLILAGSSPFAAWTMGGLENNLLAFSMVLCVFAFDSECRAGRGVGLGALGAALVVLTRADGFVIVAFIAAARLHHQWRAGIDPRNRSNALWFGSVFVVIVGLFAWRYWYYHEWLPNTAYAKVGLSAAQVLRGFRYVKNFAELYGGALFIPLIFLGLVRRDIPPAIRSALWIVAGWVLYIIKVGGDGLDFCRFFGFIVPLIALLATWGLGELMAWAWATIPAVSPPRLRVVASTIALAAAALGAQRTHRLLREADPAISPYHHFDNYFVHRCSEAGRWLEAHAPPEAVIASTPAGAIAFFGRRHVIDMLGLTDHHIARIPVLSMGSGRAGHEKGDGHYVLDRKPDYILLGNVAVGPQPLDTEAMQAALCNRSEKEIWQDPRFGEQYELRTVDLGGSGLYRYFSFYQRRP